MYTNTTHTMASILNLHGKKRFWKTASRDQKMCNCAVAVLACKPPLTRLGVTGH